MKSMEDSDLTHVDGMVLMNAGSGEFQSLTYSFDSEAAKIIQQVSPDLHLVDVN